MITHVNFVLDETGSMNTNKAEVISGFNKYLADLQADGDDDYRFSLLLFDSAKLDQRYNDALPSAVVPLTDATYNPGAMTPLYDAIAHSIRASESKVGDGEKCLTVILTDGEENASQELDIADLKALMNAKEGQGWAFMYLGVAVDAWAQAEAFAGTTAFSNALRGSGPQAMASSFSLASGSRRAYAGGAAADSLVSDADRDSVTVLNDVGKVVTPTRRRNAWGK